MLDRVCVPVQRSKSLHVVRIKAFVLLTVLFFVVATPVFASGKYDANVTFLKNGEYQSALLNGIRGARKGILFSFYLFKTTESPRNLPRGIAEELIKAKNRGVDVTVILEQSDDTGDSLNVENHRTAALLSRKGIKVFFDSPRTTTHLKVALIDNRYVFLGSHNLTQSALKYNNELSVLIDSPAMASEIRGYLNRLTTR
jgi:phosphatidylserine/phosphatidylglycerophosphate/cardiolipin synthase-like enzyme